MASTISPLLQPLSLPRMRIALPTSSTVHPLKPVTPPRTTATLSTRRQLLLFLTATTAITTRAPPSVAQDIPLFGLRKKLKEAEKEAEEIVKEGFVAAEKGLETAEIGIETAEKGIETAEIEIETVLSFGGLAQAGVVAGAEFVGVVVATSVVNAILGPDA